MKKSVAKKLRAIAIGQTQLAVDQKKLYRKLKNGWKENMKNGKQK